MPRHLPGSGAHGVFRSSIRVFFEVAQATLSNWSLSNSDDDEEPGGVHKDSGDHNIYLEVYLGKQKKVRCHCKAKKKDGKGKKNKARGKTMPKPEQEIVRWRKTDDENFLVALFTLGKQNWRVAEGEDIKIFAEVFRVRARHENELKLLEVAEDSNVDDGVKVCSLQGSFQAGNLGMITLRPKAGFSEDEEVPELTLELRPPSSRSFALEEAQPREKHHTIEEMWSDSHQQKNGFRRMHAKRLSQVLQGGRQRISGIIRTSINGMDGGADTAAAVKHLSVRSEGSTVGHLPSNTSWQRGFQNRYLHMNGASSDGAATDLQSRMAGITPVYNGDNSDQAANFSPVYGSGYEMRSAASRSSNWRSKNSSSSASRDLHMKNSTLESGLYASSGGNALMPPSQPNQVSMLSRLTASVYHGRATRERVSLTRLRNSFNGDGNELIGRVDSLRARSSSAARPREPIPTQRPRFNLIKALIDKLKPHEPRPYDHWVPTDWVVAWKSPWPIQGDDLGSKWEVVPLMEAEFRRDCVIFFNTLFPRVRSKKFALLRSIAASTSFQKPKSKPQKVTQKERSSQGSNHSVLSKKSFSIKLIKSGAEDMDDSMSEASSSTPLKDGGFGKGQSRSNSITTNGYTSQALAGKWYMLGPDVTSELRPEGADLLNSLVNSKLDDLVKDYAPRIWFLKRLMICFASCGLHYNEGGNSVQVGELWPYPLASILGHGSRVLIRLEDVEGSEFLNFLLTGDPHSVNWKDAGMPWPLRTRAAATHSVQLERETGHLSEKKLKTTSAGDTMQNIMDGVSKKHLGLNMPIGGAGNQSPLGAGHLIGFSGRVIRKDDWKMSTERRGKKLVMKVLALVCCRRKSSAHSKYGLNGTVAVGQPSKTSSSSNGSLEEVAVSTFIDSEAGDRGVKRTSSTEQSQHGVAAVQLENQASPGDSSVGDGTPQGDSTPRGDGTPRGDSPPRGEHAAASDSSDADKKVSTTGSAESQAETKISQSGSMETKISQSGSMETKISQSGSMETHESICMSPRDSRGCEEVREGWSVHVHHKQQHAETWRQVPKVQGGHMYIRVDDFGEHTVRHMGADNVLTFSTRAEEGRRLRERGRQGFNATEQAILRWRVENSSSNAGILFFPASVPALHRDCKEHLQVAEPADNGGAGFPKLIRMSSEPSIQGPGLNAPPEAAQWVSSVLKNVGRENTPTALEPPSAAALRLLLEHFNPLGASLIGTSHFKSVEDLYHEVTSMQCCIFMDKLVGAGLQRYVEPVVLQLRFRGRLLMCTHQRTEGEESSMQRNTFICTRAVEEGNWRQALRAVLIEKLNLNEDVLQDALEPWCRDDKCHSVLEESMVSPSYPGLTTHYRTHMLQWDISEDCDIEIFRRHGLPVNMKARKKRQHSCDFTTTMKLTSGLTKTLYWSWVPEVEARRLQKWVNLGEASADERWARYAFQRQGAVQFPPTEAALRILLRRCGIDVDRFGSGARSLTALWRELTNQEAYLQMSNGQPLLAVEHTVVMVRWRTKQLPYQILVQVRQEHPDGRVNETKKLLGGRKLIEEQWSTAALRVVVDAFQLTKQQVTSLLAHNIDDAAEYSFVEEQEEASRFPGIDTLLRTHLVTCTLKEDCGVHAHGRTILGVSSMVDSAPSRITHMTSYSAGSKHSNTKHWDAEAYANLPPNRVFETEIHTRYGPQITEFQWMLEDDVTNQVNGMNLFRMAASRVERHKISSILIGLEGADPGNVSAFGQGHDASGASSKISAAGGRKWRAYRTNAALQMPADIGGMRMRVSKKMFDQIIKNCESIDLLDPSLDLLWEREQSYPRELLEHHYAEKELFKRILMGSAVQANQALEWMKAYRELHKTPAQVHEAVRKNQRKLRRLNAKLHAEPKKGILKKNGQQPRLGHGPEFPDIPRLSENAKARSDSPYRSECSGNDEEFYEQQMDDSNPLFQLDPRGPLLPSPPLTSDPVLLARGAKDKGNLARILPSRPLSSPTFSPNGCRSPTSALS